jgi:hypothetical protein
VTTTIAVKEATRDRLKRIMKEEGVQNLDQAINALIEKAERLPKSMFGVDKTKSVHLSKHEHEEFQR